jgi:predicted O-methyltransferase YrrM
MPLEIERPKTKTEAEVMDGPLPPELVPAWERFFDNRLHKSVWQISGICDAAFYDGVLFPLQRRRELARMLEMARIVQPQTIMEIGTDKGSGLLHWCLLPTARNIIACEVRGTPYSELFERAFPDIDFLWLDRSSLEHDTMTIVQDWLSLEGISGTKIDVLFIDGDKSFFDRDFDLYRPLVSDSGVVFMHDIRDPAPGAAYTKVCNRGYEHQEIVDVSEADEAVKRMEAGIPSTVEHENWLRHWRGASCGVGVLYMQAGVS